MLFSCTTDTRLWCLHYYGVWYGCHQYYSNAIHQHSDACHIWHVLLLVYVPSFSMWCGAQELICERCKIAIPSHGVVCLINCCHLEKLKHDIDSSKELMRTKRKGSLSMMPGLCAQAHVCKQGKEKMSHCLSHHSFYFSSLLLSP